MGQPLCMWSWTTILHFRKWRLSKDATQCFLHPCFDAQTAKDAQDDRGVQPLMLSTEASSWQPSRRHSRQYTASLFLQWRKQQRHSEWPCRLVVTSGTRIVHGYHPGPLHRNTAHQNNPLHLCLKVSVNKSQKRLLVVQIWRDDDC